MGDVEMYTRPRIDLILSDILSLLDHELSFQSGLDLVRKVNLLRRMDDYNYIEDNNDSRFAMGYPDPQSGYGNVGPIYMGMEETESSASLSEYSASTQQVNNAPSNLNTRHYYDFQPQPEDDFFSDYEKLSLFSQQFPAEVHSQTQYSTSEPPTPTITSQAHQHHHPGGHIPAPHTSRYVSQNPSGRQYTGPPPAPHHHRPIPTSAGSSSHPQRDFSHKSGGSTALDSKDAKDQPIEISDDETFGTSGNRPSGIQLPSVDFAVIGRKRYLTSAEREAAISCLKDGMSFGLWEKQALAEEVLGPNAPESMLKMALETPKVCNNKTQIDPRWREVAIACSGGKRSTHLIASQFWKMHKTFKAIQALDRFTGGDGDGNVSTEAGILDKLGKKISKAREAGVTGADNLSPWEVNEWKFPEHGIFALFDSKMSNLKHPALDVGDFRDGQSSSAVSKPGTQKSRRKPSTHSLPGSHSAPSPAPSSGPTRTSFFTRGDTSATSPMSAHGRPAKAYSKSGSQASQLGGIKLEPAGRDPLLAPAVGTSEVLSSVITANQQANLRLTESRISANEKTSVFLTQTGESNAQLKFAQGRVLETEAIVEAICQINKEGRENTRFLLENLKSLIQDPTTPAEHLVKYHERMSELVTQSHFDVRLDNAFRQHLENVRTANR